MDTAAESGAPPKIVATERLGPAYLDKLSRQNGLATLAALLLVVSSLLSPLALLFHTGEPFISDALCTLAACVGASCAWSTTYRARHGALRLNARYQLAWFLVGLALLLNGLGRAYSTFLAYNNRFNPGPSLADIGFTLFYPLLFAGLLFMLIERRPTRACIKMGIDAAITTFCILGVSWYFFIAPTFLLQRETHIATATLVTALSYPFWDTLLILTTLMILQRCAERLLHPSLLLCGAGLFAAILADTGYAHFTALAAYSSLVSLGPLRVMSVLLIGLSALYQYTALVRRASSVHIRPRQLAAGKATASHERNETSPRRFIFRQSALLYLPLSILLALTLGSEIIHDVERAFFLVVLTAIVGLFITARYLLTMYENELLLRERERQRREAEQLYLQVSEAHQRLQELDQLKDQFIQVASHELRTPLTCVHGYLELLTEFRDLLPPEQYHSILQKAERSCTELVVLLNNIMDASSPEVAAGIRCVYSEPVALEEMIGSVKNLIDAQAAQELREVRLDIPPELAVQADPPRLRQILLNISSNALKYSLPGTPLAFSAQAAPGSEDAVIIAISDKGQGIAPEDQPRLFQRFVRLERDVNSSVRGSGLGLYISRQLVKGMNGQIWIESTGIPGEGTTVYIQLPRACPMPGHGL